MKEGDFTSIFAGIDKGPINPFRENENVVNLFTLHNLMACFNGMGV